MGLSSVMPTGLNFIDKDRVVELKELVEFVQRFCWLAEFRIVDFFKENTWETCTGIPHEWKMYAEGLTLETYVDCLLDLIEKPFLFCDSFVSQCFELSLNSKLASLQNLSTSSSSSSKSVKSVKKRNNVKAKKSYEIDIAADLIENILYNQNDGRVKVAIDVGAGQGYLAINLLQRPNLQLERIYAIESSEVQVKGLDRRSNQEEALTEGKLMIIQKHLSFETNVQELESFLKCDDKPYLLYSLHACGSLSDMMLRIFCHPESKSSILLNIGCCYNLIEDNSNFQFPLSRDGTTLTRGTPLSRNQKMLACQAPYRWRSHLQQTRNFFKRHFYRALLELVAQKVDLPTDVDPGKVPNSALDSFKSYFKSIFTNGDLDKYLEALEGQYQDYEKYLAFMWTMRALLGPVYECLILYDRAIFLRDNLPPSSSIALIPVFNPLLSPRSVAIYAIK